MLYRSSTKNAFALAALAMLLVLFLLDLAKMVLLVALAVATSFVIQKIQIRSIGVEFVSFTSIIAGITYGPWAGAITAFVLISFHLAMANYIGPYIIWVIPEYALIGFLAGVLSSEPGTIGIMLVFLVNGIGLIFTYLFNRSFLGYFLPYAITNIIFNIILFRFLAGLFI